MNAPLRKYSRHKRGRGVAAAWYGIARTATIDRAGAWAELDDGGTAKIITGVTEIGEGILTVLAQIAADELGIRPQDVTIGDNDTARSPEAAHAGATRQTYMIGNAVALACREARKRLVKELAHEWEIAEDDINCSNRMVSTVDKSRCILCLRLLISAKTKEWFRLAADHSPQITQVLIRKTAVEVPGRHMFMVHRWLK